MNTSINDIQKSLVNHLKESDLFYSVETWIGLDGNDLDDSRQISPPSAYVVYMGSTDVDQASRLTRWGIFVIAGGALTKSDRNRDAIKLAEDTVDLIRGSRFGLKKISMPSNLTTENLYSHNLDKENMSMFGISFDLIKN